MCIYPCKGWATAIEFTIRIKESKALGKCSEEGMRRQIVDHSDSLFGNANREFRCFSRYRAFVNCTSIGTSAILTSAMNFCSDAREHCNYGYRKSINTKSIWEANLRLCYKRMSLHRNGTELERIQFWIDIAISTKSLLAAGLWLGDLRTLQPRFRRIVLLWLRYRKSLTTSIQTSEMSRRNARWEAPASAAG